MQYAGPQVLDPYNVQQRYFYPTHAENLQQTSLVTTSSMCSIQALT